MRSQKAIIVYLKNPYPPRVAADHRCILIVRLLQGAGYAVTLFLTDADSSEEELLAVERDLDLKIFAYKHALVDRYHYQFFTHGPERRFFPWDRRNTLRLKRCFGRIFEREKPGLVFVLYVFSAELAAPPQFESAFRVVDSIDLMSAHQQMANILWKELEPCLDGDHYRVERLLPESGLLDEAFWDAKFSGDRREYSLYEKYDVTLAINLQEKALIQANTRRTRVEYLPFLLKTSERVSSHQGPPIFAIGNNSFNLQAYAYFAVKVLPIILKSQANFILRVLGDGCDLLAPVPGVRLEGFVADLESVYSESSFAICPMLTGTGQQLKVLEAMAHGLPVVVTRNVATRCPVEHGVTGFVATDAQEFALYTLELSKDRALCERMGRAAKEKIENGFSEWLFAETLKGILSGAAGHRQAGNAWGNKILLEVGYWLYVFFIYFIHPWASLWQYSRAHIGVRTYLKRSLCKSSPAGLRKNSEAETP